MPPLAEAGSGRASVDGYRAIGVSTESTIYCMRCNQSFTLKSNRATLEEFERQRATFTQRDGAACRNSSCVNHGLVNLDCYQSFGKSRGGSARYRCKACKQTFTVPQRATLRQRHPEVNELVLNLLVNKMPMRRICEVAGVQPAVLYSRIHFFHKQAIRFVVDRERALQERLSFQKLRIAVDRQDHTFNWASSADRRNTKLSATGSADCDSGYVFGIELDFDSARNPFEVDLHAREIGDYELTGPFRRYAQFFLPGDEELGKAVPAGVALAEEGTKLPASGLRIHAEYVLMGHFQFLRWLMPNVGAFDFYLDQEPNIRGAFLAACLDLVAQKRADAYFVRIGKELTIDERKLAVAHSETYLSGLKKQYPTLTRRQIAHEVMKQRYLQVRKSEANAANRWVTSILPHMGEPLKEVSCLTDWGDDDVDRIAGGMLSASLHPIDRFFMLLRRRVSLLERPIASASSGHRTWYGYSAYNPEIAQKIMGLFRVIYNYSMTGKDGRTPAMRLGLAEKPIPHKEILDFV
ncbi:transposase [Hydrogenophaga sp.]|uniref:transposase n=1 Tax=Hydrogenophaga sp. TaxID=1904254 RepID=UPI003D11E768